ncbi:hypothetical protein ACFYQA_02300 [Streptomyces sp. NPDC005774]|uniref:hypothetical protein n=1 Tax=Streptomyces sp. NPDC005774 TaxID=3364728 RepID=UPI0036C0C460
MENQPTRIETAARRALDALNDLIANTTDPGVEALGARFELSQALIGAQPSPLDRAAARELSTTERGTLRFALDLAQERMLSRGDEFTDDDEAAVDSLRRMAVQKVAGHATALETTNAYEPVAEQAKCAKCQQPFDPTDTRFDGKAQQDGTPYCRRCVDRCHESTDAFHVCPICR